MMYEIINPSDPYTMLAEDIKIAQASCLLIGEGQYGLEDENGELILPVLLFNTATPWIETEFGGMEQFKEFLDDNYEAIADCLDSVMSFGFTTRNAYEEAIKVMDPIQKEVYRAKVHDFNRSSMNDIGSYAWKLANTMRKKHSQGEDSNE